LIPQPQSRDATPRARALVGSRAEQAHMSRGFGKTQTTIARMFKDRPEGYYTTKELCAGVYGYKAKYTKDEYKAVKRAAKAVAIKLGWVVMYAKLEAGTNFYFDKQHPMFREPVNIQYEIMQKIAEDFLKWRLHPRILHKLKKSQEEKSKLEIDLDQIAIDFIKFMQERLTDTQKREILFEQYYNFYQSKLKTMDFGELIREGLNKNKIKRAIIKELEDITKEELKNSTHTYLIEDTKEEDDDMLKDAQRRKFE